MKTWLFVSFFSLLLVGCGKNDLTWTAWKANKDGVSALNAQNGAIAVDHFTKALGEASFRPEVHLNFGLALALQQKTEEALQSYRNAETIAKDGKMKFMARFNLGELEGKAKRIDSALEWYQKALEIYPDSIEVKTNIELLARQQQGGGQDQQQQQDQQSGQDQQNQDQKNQDQKDKDGKDQEKKDQDKKDQNDPKDDKNNQKPQPRSSGQKYVPREFKGELKEAEVKKILGEIKQQEQKIRAEFNRKEMKEKPRDKDW